MRYKNIKEKDKIFASKFDKVFDNNSIERINEFCKYIAKNNLNPKYMFKLVGWNIGDKKNIKGKYGKTEIEIVSIRKKKECMVSFAVYNEGE